VLKRAARDERGMTLIELTIASGIFLTVIAIFFSLLISLTGSEKRADDLVTNEQAVRFTLTQLAKDVRASNPLVTLPTKTAYSDEIEMMLGSSGGTQQVVRWRLDTTAGSATYQTLFREVMSDATSSATVLSSSKELTNVTNDESATALFAYFDQHQQDLGANDSFTSGDVANCAIRVQVTIVANPNPGPRAFTEVQDVELRNRLPGGIGCG
jgi:type II secretory pathway pseudopilin PulG